MTSTKAAPEKLSVNSSWVGMETFCSVFVHRTIARPCYNGGQLYHSGSLGQSTLSLKVESAIRWLLHSVNFQHLGKGRWKEIKAIIKSMMNFPVINSSLSAMRSQCVSAPSSPLEIHTALVEREETLPSTPPQILCDPHRSLEHHFKYFLLSL